MHIKMFRGIDSIDGDDTMVALLPDGRTIVSPAIGEVDDWYDPRRFAPVKGWCITGAGYFDNLKYPTLIWEGEVDD
jgi:hypothetical protein